MQGDQRVCIFCINTECLSPGDVLQNRKDAVNGTSTAAKAGPAHGTGDLASHWAGTGMPLLAQYFVLEYPYWLNILYSNILTE